MLTNIQKYLELVVFYIRLNVSAQLAYRSAFFSQLVAMLLNNIIWIIFWGVFFTRFPVLQDWKLNDVITLWAIVTAGFGLTSAVYGNALRLAPLIVQGQLEVWMLYPCPLLPHILLGRASATAWGDMIFGYCAYLLLIKPDFVHFVLFLGLSFSVAFLFAGFGILTGSLSFYIGNATSLAEQWQFAMSSFSTYPSVLFEGRVKLLLYTLIPAIFINHFPIQALRDFSLFDAFLAMAGALGIFTVSMIVFYCGIKRYETGNLMEMRD